MELTNIFLTMRQQFGLKELEGKWFPATANIAIFFVFYTLIRMVIGPALSVRVFHQLYHGFMYGTPTLAWKFGYSLCCFLCIGMMGINVFWYMIILRGFARLFMGSTAPSLDTANYAEKKSNKLE